MGMNEVITVDGRERLKDEIALSVLENLRARSVGYQEMALRQAIGFYKRMMNEGMAHREDCDESEGNSTEL